MAILWFHQPWVLSNQNHHLKLNKKAKLDPIKSRDLNNSKLDLQGVPNHLSQSHAQLAQESFFKKPHFAENLLKKGFSLDTRGQSADPSECCSQKNETQELLKHMSGQQPWFAGQLRGAGMK